MTAPLFASLLWRFGIRYWFRHWVKLVLLVSIVALGTGAFLAIGLANRASTQSFDRFAQTVSGQSQLVVTPTLAELSLEDLRNIRIALLDTEATLVPQIVTSVRLNDRPDVSDIESVFTLVGMDLLAASNFLLRHDADNTFLSTNPADGDGPLDRPNGVYAQAETSAAYTWGETSALSLFIEDKIVELPWIGELPELETDQQAASNVLIMDWRDLSDLQSKPLHANRVDIVWAKEELTDSELQYATKQLETANPGNWVIESQGQRQATGATMTLALRMNLRALSVLSLLVAICLVFQAMDSTVARRQGEVATLHSLGVSTKLTRLLWFADACLIGFLGGGLGLIFGDAMARVSTQMVGQTINTLYYNAGAVFHQYAPSEAALAWTLTTVFCTLAGWWPARQAARAPVVETIRQGNHRSSYARGSYWIAAAVFAVLSVVAYLIQPLRAENGHAIPAGGYALAIFLIGLVATLACLSLESLGRFCTLLGNRYTSLRLALSQFRLPVTRHRLALAGVVLSVGMTASMIFLIGSFESTVRAWIGNTLQADLFIRPKSVSTSHEVPGIDEETIDAMRSDSRVSDVGIIYRTATRIQNLPTQLIGFDTEYLKRIDHTTWVNRPDNLLDLQSGNTATVNEAFASRFQKSVGDTIELPTSDGPLPLRIIGIMADYGNENGSLGIDDEAFKRITGITRPSAVALHIGNSDEIEAFAREFQEAHPALAVMTNRWLREETLRIFNRVFSITYALEGIGLLISVVGLGSMLASLLIERRSEISTLQRIGFDVRTIALSSLWEGLVLAFLGIVAGLFLGLLLGLTLVFIINKQSFGWTLAVSIPWSTLAGLSLLTATGASVVSYFVGRWSAKLPPLSEE
ncbi:FtsX-like permease family protein [Pelagicoccus sp. SDUM812002]|uniref:ABC transporter permease n=1 Tax=Pelagicoccus sp. SDUM812002 TaxID=3041266 RepID=UPI00280EE192|nr:FtsX-like permease family protein [Pelagicoccus sp. SDUM812002]MDQ8187027.1 ABC transporter permease [Pelagicoccus sp. SDUM812002]